MHACRLVAVSSVLIPLLCADPARALAPQTDVPHGFDASLFAPIVPLQGVTGLSSNLDSGDVNEDGLPDFGGADHLLQRVTLFTNEGGGTFGPPTLLWMPPIVWAAGGPPRFADVNADGHLDVVVCMLQSAGITTLVGDGEGGFFGTPITGGGPLGMNGDYGMSYEIADMDGDGMSDVVILAATNAPQGAGSVNLVRSNGDGTFAPAQMLSSTLRVSGTLLARDLDHDGITDIIYQDDLDVPATVFVNVMRGLGEGAFAPSVAYEVSGDRFGDLAAGDANGDGNLDIYKSSFTPGQIEILLGAGDSTLTAGPVVPLGVPFYSLLQVSDMDRDTVPDLLVSSNGRLLVQRMKWTGSDGAPLDFTPSPAAHGQGGLLIHDLDGDTLPDIVVPNGTGGVLLNALGPFIDIGYGQTSALGTARLEFEGSPSAGGTLTLGVTGVQAGTPALLAVGVGTAFLPFKGAVVVPSLNLLLGIVTGPGPTVGWPAGIPAGTALYAQAVLLPAAGSPQPVTNAAAILAE
jgi:hypothetical protein